MDGFVIGTPEYNHGIPAALKNAIDFLYAEWNDKDYREFAPAEHRRDEVTALLSSVASWSGALEGLRQAPANAFAS